MKRVIAVSLIFSLIISLAAPMGAVFAIEGEVLPEETVVGGVLPIEEKSTSTEVIEPEVTSQAEDVAVEMETIASQEIALDESDSNNDVVSVNNNSVEFEATENSVGIEPSGGMVISYVQATGGSGRTDEELVEIYNNSTEDIDMTGWCVYSHKSSSVAEIGCVNSSDVGFRVILPPQTAYVFASVSFASANKGENGQDFVPDQLFGSKGTSLLNNNDGRIILQDADGAVRDAVTWIKSDTSTQLPIDQGSTRAKIGDLYILERKFDDATGYYQDTDDNEADFLPGTARSSYEIGGSTEVFDACLNIAGWQTAAPEGLYRSQLTGDCADTLPYVNLCKGVVISEIAANVSEQFIEIQNTTDGVVDLSGCQLQTNRNKKTYVFGDNVAINAGGFLTTLIEESGLTLTKTTTGTVYLLSSDGLNEVDSQSYKNLAQNTSWSLVDGAWYQTYRLTPNAANVYEKYLPCADGYWRNEETGRCNKTVETTVLADCGEGRERNPATGRCRNIPTAKEYAPCKEGQYRSEETNRCRSIASAVSSLKPCADNQFRNPETNRCKKIASADELADCGEGRERNPATNRCRNVLASTVPAADFATENVQQVAGATWGWWAFGGVSVLALGYAGWQWRWELKQLAIRSRSIFTRSGK